MASPDPLPQDFYARDARAVAADLIGCRLVHRLADGTRLVLRLVEVEAYLGDGSDPASHAHRGETPRNRSMFGPPGRLYAYRSYGIHTCVNVVCLAPGQAAAVLLRAGEPLLGIERMQSLRGLAPNPSPGRARAGELRRIASGPGRLAEAMGLTLEHDGTSLLRGALVLLPRDPGDAPPTIVRGPRVGIIEAVDRPYRYFDGASLAVSPFRPGRKRRISPSSGPARGSRARRDSPARRS